MCCSTELVKQCIVNDQEAENTFCFIFFVTSKQLDKLLPTALYSPTYFGILTSVIGICCLTDVLILSGTLAHGPVLQSYFPQQNSLLFGSLTASWLPAGGRNIEFTSHVVDVCSAPFTTVSCCASSAYNPRWQWKWTEKGKKGQQKTFSLPCNFTACLTIYAKHLSSCFTLSNNVPDIFQNKKVFCCLEISSTGLMRRNHVRNVLT